MTKTKFKNILEKKSFYGAICVILIAVGAFSWATADKMKLQKDKAETSSQIASEVSSKTDPAAEIVSDVPYSSVPEKAEEKETVSSEAVSSESSSLPEAEFFVFPVAGSLYKGYDGKNLQYSETYKDWRAHLGMDIAGDIGTAVHSAADGIVLKIYQDETMGTVAEIDHGGGMTGFYCGLNKKPSVKEGEKVAAGQVIGAIDTIPCESVETPHLHFALSKEGKWVDPAEYISAE